MRKIMFLSIVVALLVAVGTVQAVRTDIIAQASTDFSGTQGQNGWYYAYIAHGDTWQYIPDKVVLFDWYDPGCSYECSDCCKQQPCVDEVLPPGSPAWRMSGPFGDWSQLRISKNAQTRIGGGVGYNSVRYWVADQPYCDVEVTGSICPTPSGCGVRAWVMYVDVSAHTTTFVKEVWGVPCPQDMSAYIGDVDTGDWIAFGVGHDGCNDAGWDRMQCWDPAIYGVPEPATIALLGLGGLALLRRRR